MKPFPQPQTEGYYWAKLIHPEGMPSNETEEDWKMLDFEPVDLYLNGGVGDERWLVFVLGRNVSQKADAFIWGPRIPEFKP